MSISGEDVLAILPEPDPPPLIPPRRAGGSVYDSGELSILLRYYVAFPVLSDRNVAAPDIINPHQQCAVSPLSLSQPDITLAEHAQ